MQPMKRDAILARVGKLKVNAAYAKKKHYRRAEILWRRSRFGEITVAVTNTVLGSYLVGFAVAKEDWLDWPVALVACVAAALAAAQAILQDARQSEGHRRIGAAFLELLEELRTLEALMAANTIRDVKLSREVRLLSRRYARLCDEARAFPTTFGDYKAAKRGLESGEELYSSEDLINIS